MLNTVEATNDFISQLPRIRAIHETPNFQGL
jgi:hypothetical protein